MEEVPSNSDAPVYDSEYTKYQIKDESPSDWNKNDPEKHSRELESLSSKDISITKPESTSSNNPESSQHKSLVVPTVSQNPSKMAEETEETDFFEETVSTPSLSSEDNKVHLKKASTLEKQAFCPIPLPHNINKLKIDINRINELDRYQNMPIGKTFVNHTLKPQTDSLKRSYVKDKDAVPGPSNVHKKRKKPKKPAPSTSEDNPALDDVRSITNCIVQNMLNKLNIVEEINPTDDVIEFNVVPETDVSDSTESPDSDKEGSYEHLENEEENFYDCEKNCSQNEEQQSESRLNFNNTQSNTQNLSNTENEPSETNSSIARASREAVIDPESEQDSLEDFEITTYQEPDPFEFFNAGNVVLVGVHPRESVYGNNTAGVNIAGSFPDWLLQIFGTQIPSGDVPSGDDPHTFCQGDGLGVHPSVTVVEIDEDEETTESSNNTAAEIEAGMSSLDMSSLPEDSQANTSLVLQEPDADEGHHSLSESTSSLSSISNNNNNDSNSS